MGVDEADFSGWATVANLKCKDGRTIKPGAFKHMHNVQVPLIWQHGHSSTDNVLGHAILEYQTKGVRAYGFFNDTPSGQNAKKLVKHKDITRLSIYANALQEVAKNVTYGDIKEVSLVLAGANDEAVIDQVNVRHGDELMELDDEAIIYTGELIHFDEDDEEDEEVEEDEDAGEIAHADDETMQDIYDSMDIKQKGFVHYVLGAAVEGAEGANAEHSDKNNEDDLAHQEGKNNMTRNVFESGSAGADVKTKERLTLSHDDVTGIVKEAQKIGSLKEAVGAYALSHGIDDIEVLFPDAQTIEAMPQFNKRRTEWVQGVLNDTRHSPFSRVKTIVADITQAEARAKGYIKGHYKIEEWFGVTKRITTPTTIYKKQKLDRDDVVDITSFDVVAWVKLEMRGQLEEELARAILISDGRAVDDEDKVKDPMGAPAGDGIRSILHDHELFVTTINVNVDDVNSSYDEVVDVVMDGFEFYKGTGTPSFYTTIRTLNKFLKAKDGMGRRLYQNKGEVAAALGVDKIVTVEPMNDVAGLIGIIVNLDDYNIGADKGGEVNTFDDFDIDYNQQKYLIETRLSGALTKIKSALVIKSTGASAQMLSDPTEPTFVASTGVVTIPTMTHVTYKNADTGATLSSGAQTALSVGETLAVQATADSGYYFANDANTMFPFRRRA